MNQMKPRFSVIIPCYNVPEEYIRRALDSIKAQAFTDYEIIIVDDGSEEEYHKVLESLVVEYEGAVLITTVNNGVSQARNTGVDHAQGEYIAFIDADDIVSRLFLQEANDAILKTGADFVIGGTKYVDSLDLATIITPHYNVEYDIYIGEEIRKMFCNLGCMRQTIRFGGSYVGRGPVSRVLKRSIAEITPFHKNLIVGEDLVWNLEVLSHCSCVCIVKSQWYWYWKNPDSALHRYNPEMTNEVKKAIATVEPLMDLKDDAEYLTFLYLIIDSIHTIRRSVLNYSDASNKAQMAAIKKAIYTEYPWTRIEEKRFFKISSIRYKILTILFRSHLLLLYWYFRDTIS